MRNIIFYFSGTGNSLQVAKTLQHSMNDCRLVSMGNQVSYLIDDDCESIGFIYPTYFQGVPHCVEEFINKLKMSSNRQRYSYAITTYGGVALNGVSQVKELLAKKGISLNYGERLLMPSNYVVMYEMKPDQVIKQKISRAEERLKSMITEINSRVDNKIKNANRLIQFYYQQQIKRMPAQDSYYKIQDQCTGCGICQSVCPVDNIVLQQSKPVFQHRCEQCVACLQYCPVRAIQYKNKTQHRERYTHPEISWKQLSSINREGLQQEI